MKERKGYVSKDKNGKWFCRITATDKAGKRRDIKRTANSKTEAREILKQIARRLDDEGTKIVDSLNLTFNDLADYYESNYAIPARIVEGQKVAGLRGFQIVRQYVAVHRRFFGSKPLREINHADLVSFRQSRLNSKTYKGQLRTITTVNRELAYLRRMFNVAMQNGWVLRNPFKCGDALILASCEKRRERILTPDEETRLLGACDDPKRSHLKPLLIALLDTGCRRGEILKLVWRDVDFENRVITIRAENSKTFKERQVGITERFRTVLVSMRETSEGDLDSLVFRGCGDVRNSFATACRIAGIKSGGLDGLTLHCLRHTAATRLVRGNLPIQLVGRLLGHSSVNTTYRYLTATDETAKQATSILESYHSEPIAMAASSFVN
jgi:integrase